MKNIRTYIALGLLCALEIILTRFVQIPVAIGTFTDRISVGFLPLMLAGALFGPAAGGITAGIADIIRANIFPQGAFNPLYTIPAILRGVVYGGFLHKKATFPRILLASIIIYIFINNLLVNYLISIVGGNPFITVLARRILTTSANLFVQLALGSAVLLPLERKLDYVRKW